MLTMAPRQNKGAYLRVKGLILLAAPPDCELSVKHSGRSQT